MSLLGRLLGTESDSKGGEGDCCCDMQIEEVESDED
jgi:hypothetical protein